MRAFPASLSLIVGLFTGMIIRILIDPSTFGETGKPIGHFVNLDRGNFASYNTDTSQCEYHQYLVEFHDKHTDNDDDQLSRKMARDVRVLCWIMTSADTMHIKAIHVRNTWASRCNTVLFMSDKDDPDFPAVGLDTASGRSHLTAKSMRAFEYVFENHFDDADWFLKADDDTYVVVENLRYFLSAHAPTEPVFFGQHFDVFVGQGYFSGGAGYVMSKEALRRFGNRDAGFCADDNDGEDVEVGRCMEKLGVVTGDSRDVLNRSRFHCFGPDMHIEGSYPDWFYKYDKYGAQKGIESMSDYPVTFHYVSTDLMYDLEYMFYHLGAYGINSGLQYINKPSTTIPGNNVKPEAR